MLQIAKLILDKSGDLLDTVLGEDSVVLGDVNSFDLLLDN
jgi:hypothetical protein